MNFKQFGVLLSVSTVVGMNVVATKALAQGKPSIKFGNAIASGGCTVADQLAGSDGRTLSIVLDNMQAQGGNRQRCILRIEAIIPSGFHVQDVQVLYQGSTKVPSGSRGTSLSRSYTFLGGALGNPTARPTITKFTSSNPLFQVQDSPTVASASCGGQGVFGINMIAQSSRGTSIIVYSPAKIRISLAPC